jgi:hypothetical protein
LEHKPVAIEKAQSLYNFAQAQGSPLSTFKLALTVKEGMELLDHMVANNEPNEQLDIDVAEAKRTGDPFFVLSNFVLMGIEIVPVEILH